MKLTKQILIIVVFLAGLMPLYAGFQSFADPEKTLEMFHIAPVPNMDMVNAIMGLFFISFGLIYLFASYLLFKRRQAGRSLAILLGFISIMSGFVMYLKYNELHLETGKPFAIVDAAKGAIIVLLGWMAKD
jgi:hypothetical protein